MGGIRKKPAGDVGTHTTHLRKSVTPSNRSGRLDTMLALGLCLSIESEVTPTVNVPSAHILGAGKRDTRHEVAASCGEGGSTRK